MPRIRGPSALACPGCAGPLPSPALGTRALCPRLLWVRGPSALACPGYAGPLPSSALGARALCPRLPWVRGPSALACPGYAGPLPSPGLGYAGPLPSPALGTRDLCPRLPWVRGPPARLAWVRGTSALACPGCAGLRPACAGHGEDLIGWRISTPSPTRSQFPSSCLRRARQTRPSRRATGKYFQDTVLLRAGCEPAPTIR